LSISDRALGRSTPGFEAHKRVRRQRTAFRLDLHPLLVWGFERLELALDRGAEEGETARAKKEEFSGFMEAMLPENSFPRSALFLLTSLWETPLLNKIT